MRLVVLIAILSPLLSACLSSHYYREEADQVSFYFKQPQANQVYFLCSLDRFSPHAALRDAEGIWSFRIRGDQSFTYFYLVDDRVIIPECRESEEDDFGGRNCLYIADVYTAYSPINQ